MDRDLSSPLAGLVERHGSARRPQTRPRACPDGMRDAALGKLSAALETAEDARGHLYAFHRLSGRADLDLQDAVRSLRDAGLGEVADVTRAARHATGLGARRVFESRRKAMEQRDGAN